MVLEKIAGAATTSTGDYRQALEHICTELGEFFGSTIGNGMSKLVEDPHGNYVVVTDGETLVRELHLRYKHPILSILLEAGYEQGRQCGDLVKATMFLCCRFVIAGLGLVGQGIHANLVSEGFSSALHAMLAKTKFSVQEVAMDLKLVNACIADYLSSRLSLAVSRHLANLVAVPLARHLAQPESRGQDRERILAAILDKLGMIIKPGGNIVDSFIVQGVGLVKDPLYWQTTWNKCSIEQLGSVQIAMVSGELYFDKKKHGERLSFELRTADQHGFRDGLDAIWARKASVLASKGIRVLITEKGIDDALVSALNALDPPVLVFRRAKQEEMKAIARHVGAFIVHDIDALGDADIGHARAIKVVETRGERCFLFQNERDLDQQTLVIRGSMYDVCDAVKHHVIGAIGHCIDAMTSGTISGFPWILVDAARAAIQDKTRPVSPRAMIAREAFLHEVEWLPRVMQANQGLDPLAPATPGATGQKVTARSVERMLKIAALTAIRLLRVDELLVHPVGWQKRAGKKVEEKIGHNEEN
ncbi:MAG: TCP-1/cpn60 chaperonin family protein [Candidatus Sigynarchaeota archaeon]